MGKIKELSKDTINQIAAGEVVERPASIVKELLENSIDAGATQIKIELEQGGITSIKIIDNGVGMGPEDVKNCIKRHFTSKLTTIEDLTKIQSFGFRGEALSSISSVSHTSISSRTKDTELGFMASLEFGQASFKNTGTPLGTEVTVKRIFENIPARKKFLRSPQTEFNYILDIVIAEALSRAELGFTLINNKKTYLTLPREQNIAERIKELLGNDIFTNLLEVSYDHPHFKLSGFVGKPQIAGRNRKKAFVFVNGRAVTDKVVMGAVKESYGRLIMPKLYPVYILFIEIPGEMVDVNVHPRKSEVQFVNSSTVYNNVRLAVSKALQGQDLTPNVAPSESGGKYLYPTISKGNIHKTSTSPYAQKSYTPQKFGSLRVNDYVKNMLPRDLGFGAYQSEDILQVHNLYLIRQVEDGIELIDQHAAHERLLFNKFVALFKKGLDMGEVQPLLISISFDLPVTLVEVLDNNLGLLKRVGFEIEKSEKNTYKLLAIPLMLKDIDVVRALKGMVDDLGEGKQVQNVDDENMKILTFLSCRSAIKAGDPISMEERRILLKDIDESSTYTCPHGRPLKIKFTLKELEKLFKRTL